MTQLVQPRLVNGPFSDPGVLLDYRFGRRGLLFDLGDLAPLSPRQILGISHVFVSHMHMDHFIGFDTLLRLMLYRERHLHLFGPPGLVEAVEAKLRAYTWNLLNERSHDFAIVASDWTEEGSSTAAIFEARSAFRRQDKEPAETRLLLDEPEFSIEAMTLDHGTPCLAFAFQEGMRINVHKVRLDELGLPVGPWLTLAKRAARSAADDTLEFTPAPGRHVSLRELLETGAFSRSQGQRIIYATDFAFHQENVERLIPLTRSADHLFIEGGFLHEDRHLAASKKHLTAAQAGWIARRAAVTSAHQMHLSSRYSDREDELRREFASSFRGRFGADNELSGLS